MPIFYQILNVSLSVQVNKYFAGHMTKMAAMPIQVHGKNTLKSFP